MLVLAGAESIFFTLAGMGLCSRFVVETAWITGMLWLSLSSACTVLLMGMFLLLLLQSQSLFCPSSPLTSEGTWGAQGVWMGHTSDSWSQLTKGMSHAGWCHGQFLKLGKKKRGYLERYHSSSQGIFKCDATLLCPWELGDGFLVLLVCMTFPFPIKPSILTHNFSYIYSSDSPTSHKGKMSE